MTVKRREKSSAISRVLEIIESISSAERPLSPADLSLKLDIPKPSIHRLIKQLESEGYLQVNMRGLLVPAERLHKISLDVIYNSRFKTLRQTILQKLTDEVGETCGIAIPNGSDMVYYDRIQTNWPLQVHLPIGSHTPIWCTASGKLYLSSIEKKRRELIIRNLPLTQYTRNTLTSVDQLEKSIEETLANDYATDSEEFIDGMVAISIPIRGINGRLGACLFVHAPVIRKSIDELLKFEPLMRNAADELSTLM
ncbi:MAG: IclR family transcriptional regulator [Colwellia sp.]|jgi:DNA-binding IclR family transcriptional regulator|nr:MAG: IclR family transcriptional regulator [Colwellia sp.]